VRIYVRVQRSITWRPRTCKIYHHHQQPTTFLNTPKTYSKRKKDISVTGNRTPATSALAIESDVS
jgi:hypothetical protein